MIANFYMTTDELYMQRALELAQLGIGYVSPNPRVGCVIVHNGKIIGEGWHQKFGEAHAEVNAIWSVANRALLCESTLYVNLEPCAHFGKTPPCADLIIESQLKKVVIANTDSNPLVAGKGMARLQAAGVEVVSGVLEGQGRELNKRFFTFIEKQRPYIVLKWAQTADGFIARSNYESKWISHELARQLVHKMRSEEDAVLVGPRTAAHDNPQLNVRDWSGRDPVRIVLDRFLRLSDRLKVFDRSQPTLLYNVLRHEKHPNLSLIRVAEEDFIQHVVRDLVDRKIQSVMVEGGAQILRLFLEANLWDEAHVVISPRTFGKGIEATPCKGQLLSSTSVGPDLWQAYLNSNP